MQEVPKISVDLLTSARLADELGKLKLVIRLSEKKRKRQKMIYERNLDNLGARLVDFESTLKKEQQHIQSLLRQKDQQIRVREELVKSLQSRLNQKSCARCGYPKASSDVSREVNVSAKHEGFSPPLSPLPGPSLVAKPDSLRLASSYSGKQVRSKSPTFLQYHSILSPVAEECDASAEMRFRALQGSGADSSASPKFTSTQIASTKLQFSSGTACVEASVRPGGDVAADTDDEAVKAFESFLDQNGVNSEEECNIAEDDGPGSNSPLNATVLDELGPSTCGSRDSDAVMQKPSYAGSAFHASCEDIAGHIIFEAMRDCLSCGRAEEIISNAHQSSWSTRVQPIAEALVVEAYSQAVDSLVRTCDRNVCASDCIDFNPENGGVAAIAYELSDDEVDCSRLRAADGCHSETPDARESVHVGDLEGEADAKPNAADSDNCASSCERIAAECLDEESHSLSGNLEELLSESPSSILNEPPPIASYDGSFVIDDYVVVEEIEPVFSQLDGHLPEHVHEASYEASSSDDKKRKKKKKKKKKKGKKKGKVLDAAVSDSLPQASCNLSEVAPVELAPAEVAPDNSDFVNIMVNQTMQEIALELNSYVVAARGGCLHLARDASSATTSRHDVQRDRPDACVDDRLDGSVSEPLNANRYRCIDLRRMSGMDLFSKIIVENAIKGAIRDFQTSGHVDVSSSWEGSLSVTPPETDGMVLSVNFNDDTTQT